MTDRKRVGVDVMGRLGSGLTSGFSLHKLRHLLAVLSVGAVVAAGWGGAVEGDHYDLLSGAIWLPSRVGQITLLSGASSRPMASVGVAPGGASLSVSQSGSDAIVVDHAAGTVRRVSGSTFDADRPIRFADDGSRLQVLANGAHTFVLDGARGVVYRVDPQTLNVVGSAVSLEAEVRDGSAVVDSTGRLWAIDTRTGDLAWVDDQGSHRRPEAKPGTGTLVIVDGHPVLVADGRAQWLDDDGQSGTTVDIGLRPGENAVVSGTETGELLVVLAKQGVLKVCTDSGCDGAAYALSPGHRFGPAVAYQGRLVVPDFTSGRVLIFASDSAAPVRTDVLKPTASFGLVVRDTILFYNDPASDRAGVIRVDGSRTEIRKYDPKHPGVGVDQGTKNVKAPQIVPPTISATPKAVPRLRQSSADDRPPRTGTGSARRDTPATMQDSLGLSAPPGDSTGTPIPPPSETPSKPSSPSTTPRTTASRPGSTPSTPSTPATTKTSPPPTFELTGFTVSPNPVVVGESVSVSGVRVAGGEIRSCQWRIDAGSTPVPCASTIRAPAAGTHPVLVDVVAATGSPASATLNLEVKAPAGDPFQILYVGLTSDTVSLGESVRVNPGFKAGPPSQCTWTVGAMPALGCDAATRVTEFGTYRVTIRATSPAGLQYEKSTTLTVSLPVRPPPDKPGRPTIVQPAGCLTANADVSISATPPTGVVNSWHWRVDGRDVTSTGARLDFHSARGGSQTVSVFVSSAGGDSPIAVTTVCLADRTPPVLSVVDSGGIKTLTVTLGATDDESSVTSRSLDVWFELSDCRNPPNSWTVHKSGSSSVTQNAGSCVDPTGPSKHPVPNDLSILRYTATATSAGGTSVIHGP